MLCLKKILGTQITHEKCTKKHKNKKKIQKNIYGPKFKLTVKLAKRTREKKNFKWLGMCQK